MGKINNKANKKKPIFSLLGGGAAKNNFSHWFLDIIPKIYLFKKAFPKAKIKNLIEGTHDFATQDRQSATKTNAAVARQAGPWRKHHTMQEWLGLPKPRQAR